MTGNDKDPYRYKRTSGQGKSLRGLMIHLWAGSVESLCGQYGIVCGHEVKVCVGLEGLCGPKPFIQSLTNILLN